MQCFSRSEFSGQILHSRRVADFSLIAVSYPPDQVLRRHSHEQAYLSVAMRGGYLEQRKAQSWECQAGGTIFHEPGERHANRFSNRGARLLVMELPVTFLGDLSSRGIFIDPQQPLSSSICLHLAERLARILRLDDPLSGLSAEGLSLELLSEALRPGDDSCLRNAADWLGRVREILHDRYRERLSLADLAKEVEVHPVHLARAFRKRYRCCVGDFVRRLRVEAACQELAKSRLTIAEIAVQVGFTDQSHLSRMLKRYIGISPAEIRKARQTLEDDRPAF